MVRNIPPKMRAIEVVKDGPVERLTVAQRPVPTPSPEELLVKVAGCGVNRADVMQRQGHYPPPDGASDILGLEISGTVAAIGNAVSNWKVGDQVCSIVTGGGYAEFCVVPAPHCLPIPEGVDLITAAALPEACMTVWTNVFDRAGLETGERFLVHGGSSGIGTTAIQMARLSGAQVFATAGTAEKCAACERLGAARAFNYHEVEFSEAVRIATDGDGVEVILDMIGGPYLEPNLKTLSVEGRLVLIGLMGGAIAEINLASLMSRRLFLTGSTLRSRSVSQKAAIAEAIRSHVWPWITDKRFHPVVHATFPFEEATEAHRTMEASSHIGKLLLQP